MVGLSAPVELVECKELVLENIIHFLSIYIGRDHIVVVTLSCQLAQHHTKYDLYCYLLIGIIEYYISLKSMYFFLRNKDANVLEGPNNQCDLCWHKNEIHNK